MSQAKVQHPRCPYCHEEVLPPDAKEACHACMSWQHAPCWDELERCGACQAARRVREPLSRPSGRINELQHYMFSATWSSWRGLFDEVAEFASGLGPARLEGISHSADSSNGVVTVWFWRDPRPGDYPKAGALSYEVHRGMFTSWDSLYRDACATATTYGPRRLAAISHSSDSSDGVVTVWFWK